MDLIHNLIPYVSLPIAAYTKSGGAVTGTPVDTQGAERKLILFIGGAIGTQVNIYTLEIQECDTVNGNFTPVADTDLIPISGAEAAAALQYATTPVAIDNSNAIKMLEYVGSKRFIVANLIAPTGAGTGSGVVGALIILGGLRNSVETP